MSVLPVCITNFFDNRSLEISTALRNIVQKIQRIAALVYEVGIKERGSIWNGLVSSVTYKLQGLDKVYTFDKQDIKTLPKNPKTAEVAAEVVLILPGDGSYSAILLPLAKRIKKFNPNVFFVNHKVTSSNPVPVESLAATMQRIADKCLKDGVKVKFNIIGHSLGGVIAFKYVWGKNDQGKPFFQPTDDMSVSSMSVSRVFSIAGRIQYKENKFGWFCEDIKPHVEKTYEDYKKSKGSCETELYTIRGTLDGLMPEDSTHIQQDDSKELTVEGYGHGGIVNAKEVPKWICGKMTNDLESHASTDDSAVG